MAGFETSSRGQGARPRFRPPPLSHFCLRPLGAADAGFRPPSSRADPRGCSGRPGSFVQRCARPLGPASRPLHGARVDDGRSAGWGSVGKSARRQRESRPGNEVGTCPWGRHHGYVSQEQWADGLMAALRHAESASWSRRAAAGRKLAAIAGQEEVVPVLERLLSDPNDTGVTQETAEALLQRRDLVGLRIVLATLSRVEEWWTADQLDGELFNYQSWMSAAGRRDQFVQQLETLAAEEDVGVREEAMRCFGGPEARVPPPRPG